MAVQLERETQALLTSLEEKVERRLYELRMPLATNVLKKIRLSSSDLKVDKLNKSMLNKALHLIFWILSIDGSYTLCHDDAGILSERNTCPLGLE